MLGVPQNNVQLCLSAGLKSGLRGVECIQVVHMSAAAEVSRGPGKVQGRRVAAADIIGSDVNSGEHRERTKKIFQRDQDETKFHR